MPLQRMIAPGIWADVVLDPVTNRFCLVYQTPAWDLVCVDEDDIERWRVPVTQPWAFLRAAVAGNGTILVAATGGLDDRLWWCVRSHPTLEGKYDGGPQTEVPAGPSFGQYAVAVRASVSGWHLCVQRSPDSASHVWVTPNGAVSVASTFATPHSSQGFLGFSPEGEPLPTDLHRTWTDPRTGARLHVPARIDDLVVGMDGPTNRIIAAHPDRSFAIWPEDGFEPHAVTKSDGSYAVSCRALHNRIVLTIVTRPYPADEYAPAFPVPVPPPAPPPQESPMQWNANHATLLKRFAAMFPLPQQEANESLDAHADRCRAWTEKLGKQFAATFGPAFGRKRADPNRPWSKDCLPYRDGAVFVGWDVMNGAGTGFPTLSADHPAQHDLTGQTFAAVEPHDWLEAVTPAPPPDPVPVPSPEPDDVTPAAFAALRDRVAATEAFLTDVFVGFRLRG